MKKVVAAVVMMLLSSYPVWALVRESAGGGGGSGYIEAPKEKVTFQASGGVGAVVPDNENVESAAMGKVDSQFNIGQYLSLGLSVGQTGNFKQNEIPKNVVFANANPQAFGVGSHHHHVNDEDLFDDNNDPDVVVNILPANDPLTKRPVNRTELSFWMAEPYIQFGAPIKIVHLIGGEYITMKPYVRGFMGAAGMRDQTGDTNVGLTKGGGVGLEFTMRDFTLGAEAMRRFTDTGKATYGDMEYFAKGGIRFN